MQADFLNRITRARRVSSGWRASPSAAYGCASFYCTVDLINALGAEKAQGKAGRIAQSLLRTDLLILDELGYLPCYHR